MQLPNYINRIMQRNKNNEAYILGYPEPTCSYLEHLGILLKFNMNNVGDPQTFSYGLSTKEVEMALLRWFMKLYKTSWDESWGYMSNGSTESIFYSLWQGRNYLQTTFKKPVILFVSKSSHYAFGKIADILNIPIVYIKSFKDEQMDEKDLLEKIENHKAYSILYGATIGTTLTSSIDPIDVFIQYVKSFQIPYYIHMDAAFDGAFLPFVNSNITMEKVHAVNISGHKFFGTNIPCSIVLIKRHVKAYNRKIEYIYADDNTLSGSRDAIAPVLWYEIICKINKQGGVKKHYETYLQSAQQCLLKLQDYGLQAWKREQALTVVVPKDEIILKLSKIWEFPMRDAWASFTALYGKLDILKLDKFLIHYTQIQNGKEKEIDEEGIQSDFIDIPSLELDDL